MAQDDLAYNFDRHSGTRGVGGEMPAQIMRPEFDANHFARLDHHHPGYFIGNREYPITGRIAHLQCVFAQSIRHLLGDEHEFVFFAAFGFTKDQFSVLRISLSQFHHFADTHSATGHQFEDQPIADLGGAEDDFVDGFLFDNFPSQRHPLPVKLPDHGSIACVPEFGIDIVAYEIEGGRELGKTDPLGVGFVSLGEAVQECKDLFRGDLVDGTITEFPDISLDDGPVGSHHIFFSNGSFGNRSRFSLLLIVSWLTSLG